VDATLRVVAAAVDLGMLLVAIPGLALDRTGVALLGAISPSLPPRPAPAAGGMVRCACRSPSGLAAARGAC